MFLFTIRGKQACLSQPKQSSLNSIGFSLLRHESIWGLSPSSTDALGCTTASKIPLPVNPKLCGKRLGYRY